MMLSLRPKLKPFTTVQEAEESMDKLNMELSKSVSLLHHQLQFAFTLSLFFYLDDDRNRFVRRFDQRRITRLHRYRGYLFTLDSFIKEKSNFLFIYL